MVSCRWRAGRKRILASYIMLSFLTRVIDRGQLEVVSGGWVMPDEAVTNFASLVNQLRDGHNWLNDTLGV